MKIAETIFDCCLLIENDARYDARGQMEINYRKNEIADLIRDFEIKEQRIYRMPLKGTFFGISPTLLSTDHKGPHLVIQKKENDK